MAEIIEDNSKQFDKNYPVFVIVIPIFNDWKSLQMLLTHLDEILKNTAIIAEVLVVDNGSSLSAPNNFRVSTFKAIKKISILELRRNLGHQRAIAVGLAFIENNITCQAVVVMDGDGEDDPWDIPRLIEKCDKEGWNKIVFAKRTKRSESKAFKFFYIIYTLLYKLLTGYEIRVGNFSIIPYKVLYRLVVISEIWNHYAAGLLKSRIPYIEISTRRSTRLAGKPQMNFVSLVTHGLSAISVYGDVVGVRLLISTCLLILFTVVSIFIVLTIKLTTNLAIPGWTSYIIASSLVILMQAVMLSLVFIFVVLSGRNNYSFIPQRDCHFFILDVHEVFSKL